MFRLVFSFVAPDPNGSNFFHGAVHFGDLSPAKFATVFLSVLPALPVPSTCRSNTWALASALFFIFTFRLVFSFVAPDPRVMFSGSPFSKCVYYPSGGVNRHSWRTDQSKWRRWLTPSMLYRIRKNIQTLKENEETNFMMFLPACTCSCFALIHTASRFCKSHAI